MTFSKNILIILLYISLYNLLTLHLLELTAFIHVVEAITRKSQYLVDYIYDASLSIAIFIYLFLLVISYIDLSKKQALSESEVIFWKKILIIKPISGITAYRFCINTKIASNKISSVIRLSYYLRNISFYSCVLSFLIFYVFDRQHQFFMAAMMLAIYIATIMYFVFEPLLLIYVWQRDKEEWKKVIYSEYFTSVKSILGYGEYFRNYFLRRR